MDYKTAKNGIVERKMKIQVDGKNVFELNDTQKRVIQNDIPAKIFREDMERRVRYIIEHKYERCFERLKREWEPKLKGRVESFPSNDDDFAELIFSQTDYESRSQREEKVKKEEHLRRTGQN